MTDRRLAVTRASAAWAAWGDALGFITELTDTAGLRHRAGVDSVSEPVPWRRRIGGRMGVIAQLPAGTYSDDTQLRLATSRAIRGDGEFDVDSFARVELVAWQAYHLGAGRGSKAAAAGMARADAQWNQNTFATQYARYVDVGGNGAAMRIQPHVWAAPHLEDTASILTGVLKDSVCTHGHPIGLVGAVIHAVSLSMTMQDNEVPRPGRWPLLVEVLRSLPSVIAADEELGGLWMPAWQQAAGRPLAPALSDAIEQATNQLESIGSIVGEPRKPAQDRYRAVVDMVGGFDDATRGSGTATALVALYLAATAEDPVQALQLAANTLGSDTDTIATMAGALMGVVIADRPPTPPQDSHYIDREAARMHAIATGTGATLPTHRYPDLLTWSPPRAALDLVGLTDRGDLALAGHGTVKESDAPAHGGGARTPTVYQWRELATGQHIYLRFRTTPKPLPKGLLAPPPSSPTAKVHAQPRPSQPGPGTQQSLPIDPPRLRVDEALQRTRGAGYSPVAVGRALLEVIESDPTHAVERAAAFAAALARDVGSTRR